jgi:hypothetical protein
MLAVGVSLFSPSGVQPLVFMLSIIAVGAAQ